jgi:hypothetical protein
MRGEHLIGLVENPHQEGDALFLYVSDRLHTVHESIHYVYM